MSMSGLNWQKLVASFHIISANELLSTNKMARHQDVREKAHWLKKEKPLALIFVSHRWETLQHPDPSGRQLRALQEFLTRTSLCIEAMFISKAERLQLIPALTKEGSLQAEEVARRILGFGPFSDNGEVCIESRQAKRIIAEKFAQCKKNRPAFRQWLLSNIGVWLDYTCMPQKPLTPVENVEFTQALSAMDSLVKASTLVALRNTQDDYAMRGWCASEFFIASEQSFSRCVFINIDRLESNMEVDIAAAPKPMGSSTDMATLLTASFNQDLAAFQNECERWLSMEGSLVDITPPNAWSGYRSLQGSSFFTSDMDPNPARLVLEAIRNVETALINRWFMSTEAHTIDVGNEIERHLTDMGLRCAEKQDLTYLGLLSGCHGWIDALRPLFKECLGRYLRAKDNWNDRDSTTSLVIQLLPIPEKVRASFFEASPSSANTWHFRLSTKTGHSANERMIIDRIKAAFEATPPVFNFLDT